MVLGISQAFWLLSTSCSAITSGDLVVNVKNLQTSTWLACLIQNLNLCRYNNMNQSVQKGKRRKTNDLHCSYRNPDQGKGICNNLKTNLFKLHRIKYRRLATTFKHIGLHKSTTQQIIRSTNAFIHLFD